MQKTRKTYYANGTDIGDAMIHRGIYYLNGAEATTQDWAGKPSDWSDIRKDCPANSVALYTGHTADYSQYDNLGFIATCTGGYKVFIDGTQYGTTYANNAQCSITWSTSGITTGDDITTPSAMKAHKIWIEPATEGNNITAFYLVKVGSDNNKGTLWVHFNLTNNITFSEAFKVCDLLTAITAKKNVLNLNYLYTAFQNCPLLEYLPILNVAINNINADNFISYCNSITSITLKNSDKFNIGRGGYCSSLKTIKADKYLYITQPNNLYRDCPVLENLPMLKFANNITSAENVLRNNKSLKPFDIDISNCTSVTKFTCLGENTSNMLNLRSLRVSNSAPFDNATPPQIDVSCTSMDRTALVQLFDDLPTVSDGQIINITGCTGSEDLTADDVLIATNKGWTVTGGPTPVQLYAYTDGDNNTIYAKDEYLQGTFKSYNTNDFTNNGLNIDNNGVADLSSGGRLTSKSNSWYGNGLWLFHIEGTTQSSLDEGLIFGDVVTSQYSSMGVSLGFNSAAQLVGTVGSSSSSGTRSATSSTSLTANTYYTLEFTKYESNSIKVLWEAASTMNPSNSSTHSGYSTLRPNTIYIPSQSNAGAKFNINLTKSFFNNISAGNIISFAILNTTSTLYNSSFQKITATAENYNNVIVINGITYTRDTTKDTTAVVPD